MANDPVCCASRLDAQEAERQPFLISANHTSLLLMLLALPFPLHDALPFRLMVSVTTVRYTHSLHSRPSFPASGLQDNLLVLTSSCCSLFLLVF